MAGTLSPMMKQYLTVKDKYKDSILLYRLGDFYEMFFDDAIVASKELDITLTGRDCGLDKRAPMCGVPYHSVDGYISRLISKGYKVSICEQKKDEDTNEVTGREVTRTITPGTVTDPEMLDSTKNRYIVSAFQEERKISLCFADLSTGDVILSDNYSVSDSVIYGELTRYSPNEIYLPSSLLKNESIALFVKNSSNCIVTEVSDDVIKDKIATFPEKVLSHLGDKADLFPFDNKLAADNFGFLLGYLYDTQLCDLRHLNKITVNSRKDFLEIDSSSWRNLEITENMRTKEKHGSLLGVLDRTCTAMGARFLRKSIERPYANAVAIVNRLNAVRVLIEDNKTRDQLYSALKNIRDIERLNSKIVYGTISPRDLIALSSSLSYVSELKQIIEPLQSSVLKEIFNKLDSLPQICTLISKAIIDDPPVLIREGGFIKKGYNEEIDRLRSLQTDAKGVLAGVEQQEKERTGIKTLRIGYNKVFGYYIEVTNSFLSQVPEEYIRKQTLVNAERYITPELKRIEEDLLSASDKLIALENNLYREIVDFIGQYIIPIKETANAVGYLDMLVSFANVSAKNGYVQPDIDLSDVISIKNGRHPVLESLIKSELFIPNDTYLNTSSDRMAVITGPNMAGKSTYMRQVALIVIMAQIGCFVPAYSAQIGVVDKIFTRVGATDDLVSGQSTFMMEMNEVAYIVKNATKRSLLIFDEIGRGTSTFDGMSIAQAVLENVSNKIKARSLFATHYHELTSLEEKYEGIKNYSIAAKKRGKDIIFLRKIVRGGTDDSYGIDVARLAGVPDDIIRRAEEILSELENGRISYKSEISHTDNDIQTSFKNTLRDEIIDRLIKLDATVITPVEALNELYDLSQKAKEAE
ncbi:MAG: DNA mismatch repair protein MutS [Clostridia bacterium]|nr:DNA mismatch repair protein MutS [Clostridia bacterium]